MDNATLKKLIITAMSSAPEIEGLEDNDLILTTSAGIIFGKLISDEEANNDPFAIVCGKIAEDYQKENFSSDSCLPGNDGYLYLKDVKIKSTSSNLTTRLPLLIVFFDQIIGVSIGRCD